MIPRSTFPLIDGFRSGVAPPPEMAMKLRVCENTYLPNSPEGAKYSIEAVPAHGFVFDALEDSEVTEVDLLACVGFGKTALLEAWVTDIIGLNPGDTLVIGQTTDMVKDWMESRMRKVLLSSPTTSQYVPTGSERSNWKKDSVIFRHMNFFAGAANKTDTQEKSMVNTAGDEAWRWDFGMIDFLRKRHHGRWNRKSLIMSQGGDEGTEWHQDCIAGKWHDWEHECPKCKTGSIFDFGNFEYEVIKDINEELDWPAIFESILFKCPHCGEKFEDTEYNRRQWAKGKAVWNGNKHIPGRVTLAASFMTVWRYRWRDIIKEWIVANEEKRNGNNEKLQNVINQRFAQFWKAPSDIPTLNISGDPYSKTEFHEGAKWELEDFRFMSVDVQKGHFWAVIRAWKIGGESRLLWEGRLESWDNIRYLQERYNLENRFVFVDCGYMTEQVAQEARDSMTTADRRPWNLLRGDSAREGYVKIINGRKFRKMVSDYCISPSSDPAKQYRYIRYSNLLVKDRLSVLMGSGDFGIPVDVSKTYHAQMQSEKKVEKSPGSWEWQTIKKGAGSNNHLWDCECMQVTAASLFKVLVQLDEIK